MVLFSRNPRLRSLSKIYGFFLIIGSGTLYWMKLNKSFLLSLISSSIKIASSGKDPLDSFLSKSKSTPFFEIKDPAFKSKISNLQSKEKNTQDLINNEEFIRMQMFKALNKTNTLH